MMDQINRLLDLTPDEQELFLKYRHGFGGEKPIADRFFDYFEANQMTSVYATPEREPAAVTATSSAGVEAPQAEMAGPQGGLVEELSIWILAPLIFVFLGFDHGQMRRYFIGLVPNRYFELSLTVLDSLDDAIGRYLRGTLVECFLVGLTFALGLFALGIPLSVAVAIGLISGLANAIPFLGTIIGLVVGLGYALIAENVRPLIPGLNPADLAVYVVVLVGIAHLLDNIVYQPFVLGKAVNLHPLVVVIAIISGSLLAGMLGMLLAIPVVVVLKTAVETLFQQLKDYRII
jgi:predicted PurR-regulated permease PerM